MLKICHIFLSQLDTSTEMSICATTSVLLATSWKSSAIGSKSLSCCQGFIKFYKKPKKIFVPSPAIILIVVFTFLITEIGFVEVVRRKTSIPVTPFCMWPDNSCNCLLVHIPFLHQSY